MKALNSSVAFASAPSFFAALALVLSAGSASAQSRSPDEWRWNLTPYLWATDVHVDVGVDGRTVVDQTIPVKDLVEDIDWTFQGRIEAQKGAHGWMLDLFTVSMSDTVSGLTLPQGAGNADLDWQMDLSIADIAGIFDPHGDGRGFALLYGARIIDQRADVDADFDTPSGPAQEHFEINDTLVDALLGLRFDAELSPRLSFRTEAEVTTGGTDLTWSAFPTLNYAFGPGCALQAGYKHMVVDFEDEGGLESELTLSGPVLGLRISL